ncbi:MAG: lipoyl(octanoyl) transferase LipB [Sheuella sp.]|nr:lipoyl(octanoyl) transferase LipB [Sheuella sp.]
MIRRWPGLSDYQTVWQAMQQFTADRTADTADEIWLVEHHPVYTLGLAGKSEHLLNAGNIPVVKTDRGGQITYHGPGQVMAYVLMDLKRAGIYIKEMVNQLEESTIVTLAEFGIEHATRKPGAPGVYVPGRTGLAKIAALGIKVRNGCTYHGMALNIDMDLTPFDGINPCGYAGLQTVCMANYGVQASLEDVGQTLAEQIATRCALTLS